MINCEAILFDMDGVLVDSTALVERVMRQWAKAHDIQFSRIASIYHGRTTMETLRLAAPHLNAEREARYLDAIERNETEGLMAFGGAAQLLPALPDERWGIVTSAPNVTAVSRLKHVGLPLPRVLVSADHVVNGKPAAEPYLLAAARLGVEPSRCVVIEDAPAGMAAGRAAGATVIAVASTFERENLVDADVVIDSLEELIVDSGKMHLQVSLACSASTNGEPEKLI